MKSEVTNTKMPGLSELADWRLREPHQRFYEEVVGSCFGPPGWRSRKEAELHEVLALAEVSKRFEVLAVDAQEALKVVLMMRCPVPCMPRVGGELKVEPVAQLGVTYRQESVRLPQPGASFVQVMLPPCVWHPNVGWVDRPGQPVCLGPFFPRGVRMRELILLSYAALTLQSVTLDPEDVAGVFNREATEWWLHNGHRIPLTREPFVVAERGGA